MDGYHCSVHEGEPLPVGLGLSEGQLALDAQLFLPILVGLQVFAVEEDLASEEGRHEFPQRVDLQIVHDSVGPVELFGGQLREFLSEALVHEVLSDAAGDLRRFLEVIVVVEEQTTHVLEGRPIEDIGSDADDVSLLNGLGFLDELHDLFFLRSHEVELFTDDESGWHCGLLVVFLCLLQHQRFTAAQRNEEYLNLE